MCKLINNPLVSVIIPVLNGERTIKRAIDSLHKFKSDELEIVVIDGKSTDSTLNILKKYNNDIDILISEKDNGMYDAFNKGITRSTGKWIIILASDDEMIVNPIKVIKKHEGRYDDFGIITGATFDEIGEDSYKMTLPGDESDLEKYCSLNFPATFIRRDIYDKYGLLDSTFKCAADRELFLRFYKYNLKFLKINEAIVVFHMGGISTDNPLKYALPEDRRISIKYGAPRVQTYWLFYNRMFRFCAYKIYKKFGIRCRHKKNESYYSRMNIDQIVKGYSY